MKILIAKAVMIPNIFIKTKRLKKKNTERLKGDKVMAFRSRLRTSRMLVNWASSNWEVLTDTAAPHEERARCLLDLKANLNAINWQIIT